MCACVCVAPGIAQVSAEKGYRVLLKDKDLGGVARGQKYIDDNLKVRRLRTPTPPSPPSVSGFPRATSLCVFSTIRRSWPSAA
jgi:hypothetical protein